MSDEIHAHHWMLGTAVNRECPGKCRDCGAERTFIETIYGRYDSTPAVMPRDPLLKRTLIGGYGLPNYY